MVISERVGIELQNACYTLANEGEDTVRIPSATFTPMAVVEGTHKETHNTAQSVQPRARPPRSSIESETGKKKAKEGLEHGPLRVSSCFLI